MTSVAAALHDAAEKLARLEHASPDLEASILLQEATAKTRTQLIAWPDALLGAKQLERFQQLLNQRLQGRPIAYILGRREFWSLELEVNEHTLIPRPETELLVELALERLPPSGPARILDLGCGSGAIAAALAWERKDCSVMAVEHCAETLAVAKRNFERLGLSNVSTLISDWFENLDPKKRFDMIISNPPYIPEQDPHLSRGDLPLEPKGALASGPEGLDDLMRIIQTAGRFLSPNAWLLVEHGFNQGANVRELLLSAGFSDIQTHQDLAGNERASGGRWTSLPG